MEYKNNQDSLIFFPDFVKIAKKKKEKKNVEFSS